MGRVKLVLVQGLIVGAAHEVLTTAQKTVELDENSLPTSHTPFRPEGDFTVKLGQVIRSTSREGLYLAAVEPRYMPPDLVCRTLSALQQYGWQIGMRR